ncbi:MAG: DUF4349 domain-containing protein [Armatimonadota bacterium]
MTTKLLSRLLLAVLFLSMMVVLASCAPKKALEGAMSPPVPTTVAAAPEAKEAVGGQAADAVSNGSADQAAPTVAVGQRRIITTGDMTIEVISLDKALADLTALVKANGGFLSDKSVSAEGNWRTANLTVRVPADKFDVLHDGARGLGTVKREQQKGDDVTKQWQDLEARMKIRKQEEQSLLALMQKQAGLSDLLQVEKRLWEVREQIEQSEGELRYLRDQVTLATLTITLNEQVPVGVERIGRWNLGYHVLHAVYAMGRMLRGLAIGLIYVALPGAIIWVPLLLIALRIRRRLRERREHRLTVPEPPSSAKG